MTGEIRNSTNNFFGNQTLRYEFIESMSGYMFVGGAVLFYCSISAGMLITILYDEIKWAVDNRTLRMPDATFWGGTAGYAFGFVCTYAFLGQINNNPVVYQFDHKYSDRKDPSDSMHIVLRDPETVIGVAWLGSGLICWSSVVGMFVANICSYSFSECKERVSTLRALELFRRNYNPLPTEEPRPQLENDEESRVPQRIKFSTIKIS